MIGILYFSSTGNSFHIAKQVQDELGGKVLYIPNYAGNGGEFEKIIIVTPIYSFGMPVHVLNLLNTLNKTTEIIVIQNYGGMVGGADYLFYDYAINKFKLNVVAMYKIKMPENFTLSFTVPKFYLNKVLKASNKNIAKVIKNIKEKNYVLPKPKKTKEQTYLKNKGNWRLIGSDFHTTSSCTKCGKCVNLCPANNISLSNDKIEFGNNCVACLGCYHRCPNKAIKYKNKNKKFRYVNPNINELDIGKDF